MTVKHLVSCALLGSALHAHAGGIENTILPIEQLFTDDQQLIHIGYASGKPMTNGKYADELGGGSTGTGSKNFMMPSLSYKHQINDQLSAVAAYHMPYEAEVDYQLGAGLYSGMKAKWKSHSYSALINYKLGNGFAVHGGAQIVRTYAQATLPGAVAYGDPAAPNYQASSKTDLASGYITGVSYEIPAISLLARLTYESEIEHEFDTTEVVANPAATGPDDALLTLTNKTKSAMPEAITLSIESGVAENTLAYFNARHVAWKAFDLSPAMYSSLTSEALLSYGKDSITYELGMGHKLSEQWSVGGYVSYEKAEGAEASPLVPSDGSKGVGVGASYQMSQQFAVNAGLGYFVSDIDTQDAAGTQYKNMYSTGFDVSVDYSF